MVLWSLTLDDTSEEILNSSSTSTLFFIVVLCRIYFFSHTHTCMADLGSEFGRNAADAGRCVFGCRSDPGSASRVGQGFCSVLPNVTRPEILTALRDQQKHPAHWCPIGWMRRSHAYFSENATRSYKSVKRNRINHFPHFFFIFPQQDHHCHVNLDNNFGSHMVLNAHLFLQFHV